MKKYVFLLPYVVSLLLLAACAKSQSDFVYKELEPSDFQRSLQAQNGMLLDVRTPEEYTKGHLSDALNIDYKNDDFESQLKKLDTTKTYFLYCKGGVRSEKAADLMKELGFKQVYNLDGGIDAWQEEGLPVSKQE
ncbi:rhodanese-like domain-containing protein [Rhodocytophaga rosea]|uniref:Rhodanese-like domain-containing protein n=1 Tax=Rhodocytophaga rosea TaxID=2704465 RepID=A0A6C0GFH8_9BACT|nr:rhodanese-like domain-containing protein [Rhodocytophaga rosea]QHT66502.1 rhodanese-like domain-containing protein [Rhodocytophaga rosea]